MKSIIQSEKKCYLTETESGLHEHHIFGGANRKLSEQYGLKIYLRADLHNMSDGGVHFDKRLDRKLKRLGQKKAMEYYGWSVEDFIRIFGRNYL